MKVAVNFLLVAGCFTSVQAFAQIDEPDINADCVKAGIYASAGKVAYQQGEFAKAREVFRNQVAWSEFCHKPQDQIATAYNNIALTYIRQGNYRKAKAWLMLAPADKNHNTTSARSSQNSMRCQNPRARRANTGNTPVMAVGIWWTSKPKRHSLKSTSPVSIWGRCRCTTARTSANSVVTAIKDNHAVYHEADDASAGEGQCTVEMNFADENVRLHTTGDCGFGHNVQAEGEFVRVTP